MLNMFQDEATQAAEQAAENLEQAADQASEAASDLADATGANPNPEDASDAMAAVADDPSAILDPDVLMELFTTYGIPLIKAIVLLILTLIIAGMVRNMVVKLSSKAKVEVTLSKFFGNLAKWGVMVLGVITIMGIIGIETTSFAAVIAAVGFAIGMAMSGTIGNVAAGVMLLVFRPFKVGDVVSAAGITAKVEEIGLFTTTFDTPDMRRIIVPNGKIFGDTIENISHHSTRRADVSVGIDYAADIDTARQVLEKMLAETEGVLQDPAPVVYLTELGGSSVDFALRAWCAAPDFWAVKERVTRNAKYALDQAGIGIPFPQRDIHVPNGITVKVENG